MELVNSMNKTGLREHLSSDDAAWALTCAFLILTMQTGFAMLEGGCVSRKNMANIMVKNVCDVSIGGISYWMFGYGLAFGHPSTPFVALGDFFFHEDRPSIMGSRYAHYFFQFSFASTATTIVSGAVAERMKLHAYMIFSSLNILVYSIPACWCWNVNGFLKKLHMHDFAGVCVIHLNGGASALASTLMLGPRINRFKNSQLYEMSSPVTAMTGMFMLMWAWLGFNCGSTFGVSDMKWKVGAVVAVCTLNGAIGGGLMGLFLSMCINKGGVRIPYVINSILGGLVSITGVCSTISPMESLVVGAIGGTTAVSVSIAIQHLKIDDPVGAIPVHLGAGLWGTLAVGLFAQDNVIGGLNGLNGVFHNGGFYLLGVNALAATLVILWSACLTAIFLFFIDKIMGIRVSKEDEMLGSDKVEHNIRYDALSDTLEATLNSCDESTIDAIISELIRKSQQLSTDHNGNSDAAIATLSGQNFGIQSHCKQCENNGTECDPIVESGSQRHDIVLNSNETVKNVIRKTFGQNFRIFGGTKTKSSTTNVRKISLAKSPKTVVNCAEDFGT